MSEYIKREDALCVIREAYSNMDVCPTADVVEVVRCKDCKQSMTETRSGLRYCEYFGAYVSDNGYCSGGEKK